jgi:uncharacterized protein (TIGR02452 family)
MAKQTLEIMEQGFYDSATGNRIELKDQLTQSIANSKLYTPEDFDALVVPPVTADNEKAKTQFTVVNAATLDAAYELVQENRGKVLALNFASAKNAGGGFLNGSEAQEESLARSSCLYPTLLHNEEYYKKNRACRTCLYTDYMIYSPDVLVFRNNEGELLEIPFKVSFVTSPAVNAGAVKRNEPRKVDKIEPVLRQRMKHFLSLCANEGYSNLVLGAWGCGVFMNDPKVIADMWYSFLVESEAFKDRFGKIVFAVLDRNERGTFEAFKARFEHLIE